MMSLLIIRVTYHTSQNRVSDTIMHVTLHIINGAVPNMITNYTIPNNIFCQTDMVNLKKI